MEVQAYIDSGADITLISLSFGRLLGFEVDEEKIIELRGVGSDTLPVIIQKVPVKIGDHEFKIKVAWSLKEDVPTLLGRVDVFDNFHVLFKQDQRIIEFTWEGD